MVKNRWPPDGGLPEVTSCMALIMHIAGSGRPSDRRRSCGARSRRRQPSRGRSAAGPSGAAEIVELRTQIGELERELEAGRARIRSLVAASAAAAVAILILLVVLVLR